MTKCLFCDNAASSKEDVWPRWLVAIVSTPGMADVDLEREGRPLARWRTSRDAWRLGVVCAACNNGWMSNLEGGAKPVVERLLADAPATLSESDQAALAAWSVKTAMVFEGLRSPTTFFYTDQERASLLPPLTAVWLAKCVEMPGIYANASRHAETPDHSPQHARIYVTTMGFGHVALQVGTLRMPGHVPTSTPVTAQVVPGPWVAATVQVSPFVASAAWPPPIGLLGEEGLKAFAGRWHVPPA
jgi:hypothetical protein